jgi:hypothetical protein
VGSAPSLFSLPGRSRDGSAPIGPGILLVRGEGHLGHISLQGLRASTLEDIRPVAALGETVRTVFCRYLVSLMGAVGLSESL